MQSIHKNALAVLMVFLFLFSGCSAWTATRQKDTTSRGEDAAIKKVAGEFAKLNTGQSYENITGEEEFHLYSKRLLGQINDRDTANRVRFYKIYQLITAYDGHSYDSIKVNGSRAEVSYVVRTHVVSAIDAFFNNVEKNVIYEQPVKLILIKEKGTKEKDAWKLDGVSFGKISPAKTGADSTVNDR